MPSGSSTSAKLSLLPTRWRLWTTVESELADRGREFVGPRAQAGVERGVRLVLELQEDEDAGRRQHQGDHRGEDEGEAEADREPAQLPPSFRSR